jgi:hypothetical protein
LAAFSVLRGSNPTAVEWSTSNGFVAAIPCASDHNLPVLTYGTVRKPCSPGFSIAKRGFLTSCRPFLFEIRAVRSSPSVRYRGGICVHPDACTIWCVKKLPCLAADAARILGVTHATVRLMESRGELRATRTESGVRIFDRADVERLPMSPD